MATADKALSLLAAANSHGDLTVKLSSLKQARDILSSIEPSLAAEVFPYVADLRRSPESLVREFLVEVIEEIGLKAIEHSSMLVPVLLEFLRDNDSNVVKKSIISGAHFFCIVLEEMAMEFQQRGKVERWLEELWMWMVKFKDLVFSIALEPGLVGTKLLALKFMEKYVLLFTSDTIDSEVSMEATGRSRSNFNVSWLIGGHPVLVPSMLMSEANRTVGILLDLLRSASSLRGSLTIAVVNCLATIARRRPLHYGTILSALLDFNPDFDTVRRSHTASIQYSLRTAFLGFLRCTYPTIIESRDRLLRALRAMNAGDAAEQAIRQVDKTIRNSERVSRETRLGREDQTSIQVSVSGDLSKKRSMPMDNEEPNNGLEMVPKRIRYASSTYSAVPAALNNAGHDSGSINGLSPHVPPSDSVLTPVEQMIAVIGAMLAEGERGAESLEILISKIHPDLLADIVITNMKHLPKSPPPLASAGNLPVINETSSLSSPGEAIAPPAPINSMQSPVSTAPLPFPSPVTTSSSASDIYTVTADSKRDPRRDPRRLDPRRVATTAGIPSVPGLEDAGAKLSEVDGSFYSKPPMFAAAENSSLLVSDIKSSDKIIDGQSVSEIDQPAPKEENLGGTEEIVPKLEVNTSNPASFSSNDVDEDFAAKTFSEVELRYEVDSSSVPESDMNSPVITDTSASDEIYQELAMQPLYTELSEEQQRSAKILAIEKIIRSDCSQTRMALLSRLVAQVNADDDIVVMLRKHVVSDYQQQKGHELVLHVLYHLYALADYSSVDSSSCSATLYEQFLLAVANSLLDTLPATDKSLSRLFGEVPFLPDSALKLLENLCYSDVFDSNGIELRDVERVTQGLGAVWSLILGRPNNREACLGIALKCAVHSQDDIRGKAIRLVANKLFQLSYITESIEQYARSMLLSAVDQRASQTQSSQPRSTTQGTEGEDNSQLSEAGTSDIDTKNAESVTQSASSVSSAEAQRLISLFFALCTKKPNLLQLAFDIYGRAPNVVKQAFHRHISIVIRALGSYSSDLLHVISNPPQGSENLLTLVLQILTQDTTSPALIATVKHLYETKLKDVTILIPMLSSFSKSEVLPIFPRLVDLPLEKFQLALDNILQGSAHTGPALTPAEVLVAIHDIRPEKDCLPLKKITDVCSACFEQRTVFTQQVLAKALNQMVDQTPLPLLFMRTVIQAIDAYPTLVDFVMELLSKLVSKQIWRMPKLWVGFLKCVAQTQPHSFPVLLKLPPPQLEGALNKYSQLKDPLAAYANQASLRASLPRSILAILGLNE